MQVDWISGITTSKLCLEAGVQMYDTGSIVRLSPSGELEKLKADHVEAEGSYDNRMIIKTHDKVSLYLSGNPVKFFQGHNLFGSTDVVGLYLDAGIAFRKQVGQFPGPATFLANEYTKPRLTRVDLTRSYRFPSDAHARAWLRSVAASARSRHGSATLREGSVYWGAASRRWSMKAYLKSDELQAKGKGHKLSLKLPEKAVEQLTAWAVGVVRFELTLRGLELAEKPLLHERVLSSQRAQLLAIWQDYFDTITFNRNNEANEADMAEELMNGRMRRELAAWRTGLDLRQTMSRPTFYRVRAELLRLAGVDIGQPPPKLERAAVPADLDPIGWDPEPIESLTHTPSEELKRQYGLL